MTTNSVLSTQTAEKMLDLNDLRVFSYVASFASFSLAADALNIHKSSVSRSVARLETMLEAPLLQRTTRKVRLTRRGNALKERCSEILSRINETIGYVGGIDVEPRGRLTVCIGTEIALANRLQSHSLPQFLAHHRNVQVAIRYVSSRSDMRAEDVDIAVYTGSLAPQPVNIQLGAIKRHVCAAPEYLQRRGMPADALDLANHDIIVSDGEDVAGFALGSAVESSLLSEMRPRLSANDPSAVHELVVAGVGIGCLLGHLCADDIKAGRLIELLPELAVAPLAVKVAFPSKRSASPAVRKFVELLKSSLANDVRFQH
ncbi:LysR family transcriptional regulator [Variovorax sp. J22R24]|uniref:LysR family transcriptional regulator n=1 Tax=Variovorax gracilis TaxID=3053502 RepID=UPI002576893D|nr:LysR family transcriptional regulator [Variovorax sp. J22R24]MDM0105742.1 LysR family transcriptional regulator [Variovorax sp. J22R24]